MRTVHKFQLGPGNNFIKVQHAAKPLHVAFQGQALCLWLLVETGAPKSERAFVVAATGEQLERGRAYVGTAHNDGLVWHVFEVLL